MAGDAVEGVSDLFTSAGGLLKPAFGNDNIVSKAWVCWRIRQEFSKVYRLRSRTRDREAYFYRLMETNGRYKDAISLQQKIH